MNFNIALLSNTFLNYTHYNFENYVYFLYNKLLWGLHSDHY